ncbi:helix-turn-helix transcriptional regulator [Marinobacterium weihaiense]|uniref:Helix-turn-helix transcriptional regulator n=1 Tax=Marinobacterium weihaiense TaxID=2851016 RepID=A0ABS6M6B4_9GAMM|nr:helix-turn-helix transcriptional regulator [Marinobacterium weihaiense]MBV0931725.1 helix-turn-helix transcriptional regulator [Marinobacterium weihaiense]
MSMISADSLDQFLSELYEATIDNEHWGVALEIIKDIFSANYVTLIIRMPHAQDEDNIGLMVSVGDLDNSGEMISFPYRHNLTPFHNQEPDQVFTVFDIMKEANWRENAFRTHWLAPSDVYHVMGVDITTQDSGLLRLRITRGENQQPFACDDKQLCERLLPHIRRALRINKQIDHSQKIESVYSRAISKLSIATLLIDEQGTVLDENIYARSIIDACDGLKIIGGRLEAVYPSDNKELKRLVKEAFDAALSGECQVLPGAMSITRPSGEVSLGLVVEPIPVNKWSEGKSTPIAMIYIRDAAGKLNANVDVARKLFGLTTAENALAFKLADGLSLEDAAEALSIKRNTARAHLRSIFSKTGIRRQTELVRVYVNSVAALGSDEL